MSKNSSLALALSVQRTAKGRRTATLSAPTEAEEPSPKGLVDAIRAKRKSQEPAAPEVDEDDALAMDAYDLLDDEEEMPAVAEEEAPKDMVSRIRERLKSRRGI